MHHHLFTQAQRKASASICIVSSVDECSKKTAHTTIFAARFCESSECEAEFKRRALGKSLCIPFNQNALEKGSFNFWASDEGPIEHAYQCHPPLDNSSVVEKLSKQACFICHTPAKRWTLFGKSY